jgi:hypothetical protein
MNCFRDRLIERNVDAAFLVRDRCHDPGIFLDPAIEFALERIIRVQGFSNRTELAKPHLRLSFPL